MKISILISALIIVFLTGCKNSKISEDEEHLDMYFKERQNIDIADSKDYFLIVISGNCGSCTEKTIKFLKQIGDGRDKRFSGYKKFVVVPENNAYVVDSVKNSTIKFIVEDGFELEKYGIKFSKNAFFEFKNSDLIYRDWLYMENVDKIAGKYGLHL